MSGVEEVLAAHRLVDLYRSGDEQVVEVTRRDFVRRSRVHLRCPKCGSTTITCDIDDAEIYEAGMREHVCGAAPVPPEALALRWMLRSLAGDA